MIWTKPYCNVTHVKDCPRPWQITMTIYDDSKIILKLLHIGSYRSGWSQIKADHSKNLVFHGTEAEGRLKAEEWLNIAIQDDKKRRFIS